MTNISQNGFSNGSQPQQSHGRAYPDHQPLEQQQPGYQSSYRQPDYQEPGYQEPGYQEPAYQQPGEQQDSQSSGGEHTAVWSTAPVPPTASAGYSEPEALLDAHTAQHNFGAEPFIPPDGREAKKVLYVGAVALLSMAVLAALVAAIGIRMNQSASEGNQLPAASTTAPLPPTSTPIAPQVAPTPTGVVSTSTTEAQTTTTQAATTTTAPSSLTIATITSFYQNCEEARAIGVAPMAIGAPGYRIGLDSDGDGLACNEPITATTQAVGTTTAPSVSVSTTIVGEPTSSTVGNPSTTTGPTTTVPTTAGPISSVTVTTLPPTSLTTTPSASTAVSVTTATAAG